MKDFHGVKRVKINDPDSLFHGITGTVWRVLMRGFGDEAWVKLDSWPEEAARHFCDEDVRCNHQTFAAEQCEPIL